jgi:salicylate hydroxylase
VTSGGVLIAGAGIGGLTASLALAQQGIGVTLFDQAEKLEEAGAGIQLSPNATRVLIALGLADRLKPAIVEPAAIQLRSGHSGREIATLPLGTVSARYGAPYWLVHRADLQKVLLEAVAAEPSIALTLGAKVDDFILDASGVHARVNRGGAAWEHRGSALIGADGLWSTIRARLGDSKSPRLVARTAWRTVAPAEVVEPRYLEPVVNLWLGTGWHLVHYPIRARAAVNIVWVVRDTWESSAWTTKVDRSDLFARSNHLPRPAAIFVQATGSDWQKWTLCDRTPSWHWGNGPVSLIGDAAHPMLPFLAQGAAMAIEDAAVLAGEFSRSPEDPEGSLRRYEKARQARTARIQWAARRNDFTYHLHEPGASIRDTVLGALGGERLLAQYDWIYQWRP